MNIIPIKSYSYNNYYRRTLNSSSISFKNNTAQIQKYLLDKYGIKADFNNTDQAKLLLEAVEEYFKKTNLKESQRPFETLEAGVENCCEKTIFAQLHHKLRFPMPDYELTNSRAKVYIKNLDEKDIGFDYLSINYNSNCDIEKFCLKIKENPNHFASSDLKFTMVHELAHWLYAKRCPGDFAIGHLIEPIFDSKLENEKKVISNVSKYATMNINEFIAEYIAGRMQGKTYPKEVDELYRKYNGLELFD